MKVIYAITLLSQYCILSYLNTLLKLVFSLNHSGRRKMAQFVIKEHFGHVTPNRIDVKMDMKISGSAKPVGNNNWTSD